MGKIIAIANQKGGVGKTTTSINLSAGLAYLGKKILLVDFDPQGNATQGVGATRQSFVKSIYDVIMTEVEVKDAVKTMKIPPLDILPATIDLAGADLEMVEYKYGREKLLKNKLVAVKNDYDYIIIDCPPSLGLLNTNALTAADSVIIPVQCEYYALEGLSQLIHTINLVRERLNPYLDIEGIVFTMFDARTNLSLQVVENVRANVKQKVYSTIIPRNVRLAEAPSHGYPITIYDSKSAGAESYRALAEEVINREEE